MTDTEILKGIKKFFNIKELVGRRTHKKHGNRAWKFLDFRLLHTVYILRVNLDRKFTANTWHKGGKFSQRGLRTIVQQLVRGFFITGRLYLSAHLFGKAIDFTVADMTAEEVRNWIIDNQDLLPYKIRLEWKKNGVPITWVHLDVIYEEHNPKVYLFNV